MSKQYGLILSSKNKATQGSVGKPSIFEEDSSSDGESSKPTGLKTSLKRQDRVVQEKAVKEDPTVYQYDEIYDEMDQRRKESKLARKDIDKKPKYISKLLVAADKRKKDNERRIERQVQKEREAEGEEFKDKESFVTMAYKKKLEEMKAEEEEERREEYLESVADVRKQGNLDGFYRHLYDQKVNFEDEQANKNKSPKRKPASSDSESDSESRKQKSIRKYRKHETNSDSNDTEEEVLKKEHLPSNLDADSDFSIDSHSDDEENKKESQKTEPSTKPNEIETKPVESETKSLDNSAETAKQAAENKREITEKENIEKKPKVDIWKKRTVGEAFEAALQRYYERKALREAGN